MKTNKIIALGAGLIAAGTLNANAAELFQNTSIQTSHIQMAELCCGYGNMTEFIAPSKEEEKLIAKVSKKEARKAERKKVKSKKAVG